MASILNVDQINNAAGTSAVTIDSSGNVLMPGHVVQVVQTYSTTIQQFSGTAWVDLTSLTTTITPQQSGSKFLIEANIFISHNNDGYPAFRLYKDGSHLTAASNSGPSPGTGAWFSGHTTYTSPEYRANMIGNKFLYTHGGNTSTSQTYKIYCSPMRTASRDFIMNRVLQYNDANQIAAASHLTIMEIAQ